MCAQLLGGCTFGNSIDVCERRGSDERDLNGRTEGDQLLSSRNAVGALPSGGAMAVWTSALGEGSDVSEVRGALVTADGTLLPTCEAEAEYTYSLPGHRADVAVVAAPRASDQLGVVVYRRRTSTDHSLWVVPITPSGCPMRPGIEPAAFQLRQAPSGYQLLNPSVASLAPGVFVVTWTELALNSPRPHLLARRFYLPRVGHGPEYLPTPLSPNGEAADAVSRNAPHANGVLASLPDGAALAYAEPDSAGLRMWLVRFDSELAPRFPPVLLAETKVPSGLVPSGVSISLAWEPDSFLVAWMAGDEQLAPLVQGMFVSGSGQYLSASRAPGGGPFRLGSALDVRESSIALMGTGEGGFLAAWQESGSLDHTDHDGTGLRALAFDAHGAVRFANRACDASDFQLNLAQAGDQLQPALARLADGTFLAAWVNNGGATADRSGAGLRAVGLIPFDLFALP